MNRLGEGEVHLIPIDRDHGQHGAVLLCGHKQPCDPIPFLREMEKTSASTDDLGYGFNQHNGHFLIMVNSPAGAAYLLDAIAGVCKKVMAAAN